MTVDELLQKAQYSIPQSEKETALLAELRSLDRYHRERCADYARVASILFPGHDDPASPADLPYLPVGLFKKRVLSSVPPSEIFRVLRSSGTSGQSPSQVVLDLETAQLQTRALSRIMTHVLGPRRLPMILVEQADLVKDRRTFNARTAGLLGMMNFGRNHLYALDSELNPRTSELKEFLKEHGKRPFLIFGFTFLVWTRFYRQLASVGLDLSNGILVHSGGWKNLQDQSVTASDFRAAFRGTTGLTRIYNFYGMVEQVGSIFLEGEDGYFYPPNFADVIVRDPHTLEEVPHGQTGVIEVVSVLPRSYPGQCLLTEDLGAVYAVDSPACGRMGKAFSVLGRIPHAELRGCSDVIAAQVN